MEKPDKENQAEGVVIDSLPNATFRVRLGNNEEILAHLSGKMRVNFIRILRGDRVLVERPQNSDRGRIIYRYK